jgi:phage I-like protein
MHTSRTKPRLPRFGCAASFISSGTIFARSPLVIPGDGLYLENIEWTPEGEAHARNYHDLSPAPVPNKKGVVVMLHSVALCPQGAVDGLSFYSNSFIKPLNTMDSTTSDNSAVDYKGLLISILQKLGCDVPDGASDSDIAGMVDQYKTPPPAPKTGDKKGDAPPAKGDAPPDPTTMSVNERFLLGEIQKLSAGNEKGAKAALVLRASQEGKVIPLGAKEIDATPLNVLEVLVEKTPATVPLDSRRPAGATTVTPAAALTLTADEKQLCVNLSIKEEDYLKEKQKDPKAVRPAVV